MMRAKQFAIAVCLIARAAAQTPVPAQAPHAPGPTLDAATAAREAEQSELSASLQEAGNSPVDFIRALERHLKKYPNSADREKIERALVRAAIEAKDDRRLIEWGERVLGQDFNDIQTLEKVSAALLQHDGKESAEKALGYVMRLQEEIVKLRKEPAPERTPEVRWQDQLDHRMAIAKRMEAQGLLSVGKPAESLAAVRRSWELYPTAAGARAWARVLERTGKALDAVDHYADAFTLEDPESTEEDRAQDRRKMGELFSKATGGEKGLGDKVLQAYDRTSELVTTRLGKLRIADPNSQAKTILDYSLPSVKGDVLKLASLRGKTVVLDFWATWCGPCRAQRPLYAQVEKKYSANPNVVFLSVNTDEDRALVAPFLVAQKWDQRVYFDAGLSNLLRVANIPTTIVLDRDGQMVSRMAGFIPERFVDMLSARIDDTLVQ